MSEYTVKIEILTPAGKTVGSVNASDDLENLSDIFYDLNNRGYDLIDALLIAAINKENDEDE